MKKIYQSVAIALFGLMLTACAGGGSKSGEKGAFCQTKPSNAICSLPGPYKPVAVGTSCSCTHHGSFGSRTEIGVVINP